MFIAPVGVLKRSIEVYRANFGSLMRYVGLLFAFALAAIITLVIGLVAIVGLQVPSTTGLLGLVAIISGPFISFLIIWGIVFFVLMLWLQIAFVRTASRAVHGQAKIGIGEELGQSRHLILKSLGGSLLVSLITGAPFFIGMVVWMVLSIAAVATGGAAVMGIVKIALVLLTLYGLFHMIYFSIRLCFSSLGIMVDGQGITESLRKSSALVKGRWWGVFGRVLLAILALMVPYYILFGLSQIGGFIGTFFGLMMFAYYILCLIPLAMIPSLVIYVSAKESSK